MCVLGLKLIWVSCDFWESHEKKLTSQLEKKSEKKTNILTATGPIQAKTWINWQYMWVLSSIAIIGQTKVKKTSHYFPASFIRKQRLFFYFPIKEKPGGLAGQHWPLVLKTVAKNCVHSTKSSENKAAEGKILGPIYLLAIDIIYLNQQIVLWTSSYKRSKEHRVAEVYLRKDFIGESFISQSAFKLRPLCLIILVL